VPRPRPAPPGRDLRAQAAAGCVVGLLKYAGTRAGLRLASGRLDHEAHRPRRAGRGL